MAKFDIAFEKTIKHEGGYANDPNDAGGETYMGISRRFYPKHPLWKTIDEVKRANPNITNSSLTKLLKQNDKLTATIKNIYETEYWNRLRLTNIYHQELANQLFDSGVNIGVKATIKLMQRMCNLKETGVISNNLINKLNNRK